MRPKIKTELPGSHAKQIVSLTQKFCINTTFAYPLVIRGGQDCYLEDVDGNVYLDFNSNVCSCPLGYGHPELMAILTEYSQTSPIKIAGQDFYTSEQAELAAKLVQITPKSLTRVFLINSGAEAVENAIKMAYRQRGPLTGISCRGAFHGRTLGALTFTFSKPVHKKNYPELRVKRIEFCTDEDDPHVNDIETVVAEDPQQIAFVITEVVQGEGGYRIGAKKFIQNLRRVTQTHGIPLIIDEIQSGMGRTGRWWAFEHYGIEPDLMTAAKALQVGATITCPAYDPREQGALSSTWGGGHRLDMAVALKTIQVIEAERLIANAARIGKYILKRLEELDEKYPQIVGVDGLGLMLRVELDTKAHRDWVVRRAFEAGLLLLGCGTKTIRIAPPLIIGQDDADVGLDILDRVIAQLTGYGK